MKTTSLAEDSLASLQWLVFLLANALALPIVIGDLYGFTPDEVAGLMQRTFFVVGLASLLQGWLGHRLPLADGPAGIWLGVFVILGGLARSQGTDAFETLRSLEGSMLLAGILLIALSALGLFRRIMFLFTPLVTGSFLMLLSLQLSGVFLKGTLGLSDDGSGLQAGPAITGLCIFVLVLSLSLWGKGWWKSYAVLIGIVTGWLVFALSGWIREPLPLQGILRLPEVLVWGMPSFNAGTSLSSVLVALVLLSNLVASYEAMNQALPDRKGAEDSRSLSRGGLWAGGNTVLSALLSTVGTVPLSVSAGFVRMTGQTRLRPFLIACVSLCVIAIFPAIASVLSQLPGPVAYAALLSTFAQMFGIGLSTVLRQSLDQRRMSILGITLSMGAAVLFLPPPMFRVLPPVLQPILGNGLLVSMMLSILLEQLWRPAKAAAAASKPQ
ncbi:purine/pyrimidine permease [Paenibacillus silviterrae]|uniref:purine/pyrimidine permease n=1 Tax=Paenibacillus silviterrae TaxID=3242194 RepID=UPI00254306D7|nr:purine/pyrimidine permease [Paenibacillus chinjuensis]